jgi:hypothetical protein
MENMRKTQQNKCEEMKSKIRSYIDGRLTELEVGEIEEHLKECEVCAKQLEEAENKAFLQENVITELPDARLIESRFTRNIVGKSLTIIILIVLGFYVIFSVILPLCFNKINMKKSEELSYAMKDLIQFGIPGARLKGGYEGKVTFFDMIKNIEYEQKTGGGGLKAGVVDLAVPLYAGKNDWKLFSVDNRQGMGYVFFYPHKRGSNSLDIVWEKLGKIGEGTKTIAAIYFEQPVTTNEMKRILDKIKASDWDTWFALDTGASVKWEYDIDKPYRELQMFSPQWGFPMHMNLTPTIASSMTKDKNGNVSTMTFQQGEHDVTLMAEQFKKEMKAFEEYSEKYFEAPEFTSDLKSLNNYISGQGIKLRGAIVGAATINILKLKDELNVARVDVVEVGFDY